MKLKSRISRILGLVGLVGMVAFTGCDTIVGVITKTGTLTGKAVYSNSDDNSGIVISLEKTDAARSIELVDTIETGSDSARAAGGAITLDSDGEFTFTNLDAGVYTVYAVDGNSRNAAVARNVEVKAGKTTELEDTLILTAVGNISGTITLDGTADGNEGFTVFVEGTSYIAVTDAAGKYTIYDVPASDTAYPLYAMKDGVMLCFGDTATVVAGETTTVTSHNITSEELGKAVDCNDISSATIKWRGYAESSDKITSPSVNDAYYDTTTELTYYYDGTKWVAITEKNLALKTTLYFNPYGPNHQNYITFLDDSSAIKANDKITLKYTLMSDTDINLGFRIIDSTFTASTTCWYELSDEDVEFKKEFKANETTEGEYSVVLKNAPIGTDERNSFSLVLYDNEVEQNVELLFTQLDLYVNDVLVETKPETGDVNTIDDNANIDNEYNVSWEATDRGILFTTRIMSNISSEYASVTFTFTECQSGISMIRNWSKYGNNYNVCQTYYPFVEAGKTYGFTVKATQSDYTLYEKKLLVKATGGLGEFKIENVDDYDVTITSDRVMKLTGEPKFTDNSNVNVLKSYNLYELYQADNGGWSWIFSQENSEKETLNLKDSDNWRNFATIDAMMSGHKYRACSRTEITVAGYQDNGQSYFQMNDQKYSLGDWGGSIVKVPVLFYAPVENYDNLPGDHTYEVKDSSGKVNGTYKYYLMDYNSVLYEPTEVPTCKNAEKSELLGWYTYSISGGYPYTATFPIQIMPSITEDDNYKVEIDGVKYDCYMMLYPRIKASFNVTLMDADGTTKLSDSVVTLDNLDGNISVNGDVEPTKTGYAFTGYYTDKACTQSLSGNSELKNNMTVYTKWSKLETLYTPETADTSISIDAEKLADITVNDTLYVKYTYTKTSTSNYQDYVYLRYGYSSYSMSYTSSIAVNDGETKIVAIPLSNRGESFVTNIQTNGLMINTSSSYGDAKISAVYYVKG